MEVKRAFLEEGLVTVIDGVCVGVNNGSRWRKKEVDGEKGVVSVRFSSAPLRGKSRVREAIRSLFRHDV